MTETQETPVFQEELLLRQQAEQQQAAAVYFGIAKDFAVAMCTGLPTHTVIDFNSVMTRAFSATDAFYTAYAGRIQLAELQAKAAEAAAQEAAKNGQQQQPGNLAQSPLPPPPPILTQ